MAKKWMLCNLNPRLLRGFTLGYRLASLQAGGGFTKAERVASGNQLKRWERPTPYSPRGVIHVAEVAEFDVCVHEQLVCAGGLRFFHVDWSSCRYAIIGGSVDRRPTKVVGSCSATGWTERGSVTISVLPIRIGVREYLSDFAQIAFRRNQGSAFSPRWHRNP